MDILVTELHQQPEMFCSTEGKMLPLKILKNINVGTEDLKDIDFGGKLQQTNKWKPPKEKEK